MAIDYELERERIARRRKVAEALMLQSQQPMGGTETVGGIAVRRSPLEGVSKVVQAYMAANAANRSDDEARDLGERARSETSAALADYTRKVTPRQAVAGALAEDASGNVTQQDAMPAYNPGADDRRAAAMDLAGRISGDPRDTAKLIVAEALKPQQTKTTDLGDAVGVLNDRGEVIARLPKNVSPDTGAREAGSDRRAAMVDTRTRDEGAANRGVTTRGQDLTDTRTRSEGAANRGVTVRGQDLTDTRTREEGAASRDVTTRGQDMTDQRSRDALEQGKVTDTQRISATYADRMAAAEDTLGKLTKGPKAIDGKPGVIESVAGSLPLVGKVAENVARGADRQQYRQAQEDWVRAKLRKESGAVIADEEMDREIRTYFPQIGDKPDVIAQKELARKLAAEGMSNTAGNASRAYNGAPGMPTVADIDAELERRKGGGG